MGSMDLTLLVCTYNRAVDVGDLLDSAFRQQVDPGTTYEIVVVDNNSRDNTAEVVQKAMAVSPVPIRYFFEGRQGKSYALNTAITEAQGEICSIADDDLILPPDYVRRTLAILRAHPKISLVGGRVLPQSKVPLPDWLTAEHYAPLALSAFGDTAFVTSKERPVCLLAASFRKRDLQAAGSYQEGLSVSEGRIGGIEDAEIYQRMYDAGFVGRYDPELSLYHKVEGYRLSKEYHRRWHRDRGRHYAMARMPEFEQPSRFRFGGVQSYVYRQAAANLWRSITGGNAHTRTVAEMQFHFLAGYIRQRWKMSPA